MKTKAVIEKTASVKHLKKHLPSIYNSYIDPKLIGFLDKNFSGWSLPSPKKWDTLWFKGLKTDSSLVNYISGDFDCNGSKDYALIFTNQKGTVVAYAFLSNGNSFKPFKLQDVGDMKDEFIVAGLELLPPGKYDYIDPIKDDQPPPIKLSCPSIQVDFFEASAETYYWDKGKLKSITTGD